MELGTLKETIEAMTDDERAELRANFVASLENANNAEQYSSWASTAIKLIDQA